MHNPIRPRKAIDVLLKEEGTSVRILLNELKIKCLLLWNDLTFSEKFMFDQEQRIAIIGSGVSGLSTAYELALKAIENKRKTKIVIFEKGLTLGGNAQTVAFSLGQIKNLPILHVTNDLVRWADLGVNDINLTAYKTLEKVMKDIGFYDKETLLVDKSPNLKKLENTECYFSLDGAISYTDDEDMIQGVIDPRHSLQHIEEGNLIIFTQLLYDAAFVAIKKPDTDEDNLDLTCSEFFNDCVENLKDSLESFAKNEKYKNWYNEKDWNDENWLKKASHWVQTLRDNVFYPRISAMYFANDAGPENMLLAAPFKYYKIQESADGKEPDRRYFVGGAQRWLEYLAKFITRSLGSPNNWQESEGWVDIKIEKDYEAQLKVFDDRVEVSKANEAKKISSHYDYAVITTHADDALKLIDFKTDNNHQEAEINDILGSISYTTSIAVCHTWSGVLPPNRNLWRSYNVLIRKGEALKPYSMTYVCNRHQNDAENNTYNLFGMPQFFVTLNPQLPIPDNAILRKLHLDDIPLSIREILPQSTLDEAKEEQILGNVDDRAITYFKHNLIDKPCFEAQKRLVKYHKGDGRSTSRLFFGGAWSNGSGLHEECWLQSQGIADLLFEQGNGG